MKFWQKLKEILVKFWILQEIPFLRNPLSDMLEFFFYMQISQVISY